MWYVRIGFRAALYLLTIGAVAAGGGAAWELLALLLFASGDVAALRFRRTLGRYAALAAAVALAASHLSGLLPLLLIPLMELGEAAVGAFGERRSSPASVGGNADRERRAERRRVAVAAGAIGFSVAIAVLAGGAPAPPTRAAALGSLAAAAGALAAGAALGHAGSYQRQYHERYDAERRARYELESARAKLLRNSTQLVQNAELRERNRIARSLHDSVGHKLSGVLLKLQAAAKAREAGKPESEELYAGVIPAVRETVERLRSTVRDMRPRHIDHAAVLNNIVRDFGYCPIDFSLDGSLEQVPPHYLQAVTATLEEALTNIARHSRAQRAKVDVSVTGARIRLHVENDGADERAFPDGRVRKEGMGLSGMRERAQALGGALSITAGARFSIVMVLPLERRAK